MALADSAAATLAFLTLPTGATTSTIEAKTNFLAAVREGYVTACSQHVRAERRGRGDGDPCHAEGRPRAGERAWA
jgi:acyl-coenzyme A thioesterase PaaI-like protein